MFVLLRLNVTAEACNVDSLSSESVNVAKSHDLLALQEWLLVWEFHCSLPPPSLQLHVSVLLDKKDKH